LQKNSLIFLRSGLKTKLPVSFKNQQGATPIVNIKISEFFIAVFISSLGFFL